MRGTTDTIFAVASGGARAAVTVLRVSGPRAGMVLERLARTMPPARMAAVRTLRDPAGDLLDRALVLWMPGPASYTGEDCCELHLHGGRAVSAGVADAIAACGARPAEAGEFSRRAFLNGKIDLLAAEAVADLIDAETAGQRRQALRQLEGELGALYRDWSARLTRLLAWQEALIDFPDEDLPAEVSEAIGAESAALQAAISAHLDDGKRGERLREGLVFAVIGPPNVGKSTLINALAGREAAIVSPGAGTTRDVLEVRVVLGDVPVTLLDTAGLRETDDPVEAEGVRRARQRAAAADLVIDLRDPATAPPAGVIAPLAVPRLMIANKDDLGPTSGAVDLRISAVTGTGLAELRERLGQMARQLTGQDGPPPLTRARHRAALTAALIRLQQAEHAVLPELRGEDLRAALFEFGRITGQVATESVLDAVFGQFCIGK